MGNAKSIQHLQVSAPSRPGEWVLQAQLPYCTLLKNVDTLYLAQEYILPKDPKVSLLRTFQIYDYRRKQNHNLVEVYQAEQEATSYLCQGSDYLRVKTERIPHRLSQFGALIPSQVMFVLLNSLIGYRTIYQFNGPSIIDDEMIGINEEGKIKVWISSNFAKNSSDTEVSLQNSDQRCNEKLMISQIMDVVKGHTETKDYPEDFLRFFQQFSPNTFAGTLQFIENYIRHIGMVLPQSIFFRSNQSMNSVQSIQANMVRNMINRRGDSQLRANLPPVKQPFIPCGFINTSVNMMQPQLISSQNNRMKSSHASSSIKTSRNESSSIRTTPIMVEEVGYRQPTQETIESVQSGNKMEPYTFTFHQINKNSIIHHQSPSKENSRTLKFNSSIQKFTSPPKSSVVVNSKPIQNPYYSQISPPSIKNYPYPQSIHRQVSYVQNHQIVPEQRVFQPKIVPNGVQTRSIKNFHSTEKKVTELYISRSRSPQVNHQVNYQYHPVSGNSRVLASPRNSGTDRTPMKSKLSIIHQLNTQTSEGSKESYGIYPRQFQFTHQQVQDRANIEHKERMKPHAYFQSLNQGSRIQGNPTGSFVCTTEVDSVRPQIRVLMMKPSVQNPVTQTVPPPLTKEQSSSDQKIQKQKLELFEMKELEVKNYLIGNSKSNPIKGLEGNKYVDLSGIPEESATYKELDKVMDSLNDSLQRMETPIAQIQTVKKEEGQKGKGGGQVDETVKIGEFKEIWVQGNGTEDEDISEIQTIVQKNTSLIQGHILNDMEEFDFTLRRQSTVPSYQQLREVLRSHPSGSFHIKSD